jgi:hypothetical protein
MKRLSASKTGWFALRDIELVVPLAPSNDDSRPLPLALCWLIWIAASVFLWGLILSPFIGL